MSSSPRRGSAGTTWLRLLWHPMVRGAGERRIEDSAASLRWALEHGGWTLTHLSGKQLVADGMTKALNGQAFERFREDLGMSVGKKMVRKAILARKEQEVGGGNSMEMKVKLLAVIGADLVGKATALRESMPLDEVDAHHPHGDRRGVARKADGGCGIEVCEKGEKVPGGTATELHGGAQSGGAPRSVGKDVGGAEGEGQGGLSESTTNPQVLHR